MELLMVYLWETLWLPFWTSQWHYHPNKLTWFKLHSQLRSTYQRLLELLYFWMRRLRISVSLFSYRPVARMWCTSTHFQPITWPTIASISIRLNCPSLSKLCLKLLFKFIAVVHWSLSLSAANYPWLWSTQWAQRHLPFFQTLSKHRLSIHFQLKGWSCFPTLRF